MDLSMNVKVDETRVRLECSKIVDWNGKLRPTGNMRRVYARLRLSNSK
jgi:hypothetical protein